MTALAASAACFALSYAGLSGVCLAMSRHHEHVWRQPGSVLRCRILRVSGWLLLSLSLVCCVISQSIAIGLVVWFGMLSVAALAVTLLLTYAPRASVPCALGFGLLGVVMLIGWS